MPIIDSCAVLIEGNSIRAAAHMCDADKETVIKLRVEAGYKPPEVDVDGILMKITKYSDIRGA